MDRLSAVQKTVQGGDLVFMVHAAVTHAILVLHASGCIADHLLLVGN